MSQLQAFLIPIFLHVIMVLYIGNVMVKARFAAVKAGQVKRADIAAAPEKWPDDVRKISNNFDNQFDLPTTWYAASALIIATAQLDWIFVLLSWAFVASRAWHTYIHIGSNIVLSRKLAYQVGIYIMIALWAWFAFKLFWFV